MHDRRTLMALEAELGQRWQAMSPGPSIALVLRVVLDCDS